MLRSMYRAEYSKFRIDSLYLHQKQSGGVLWTMIVASGQFQAPTPSFPLKSHRYPTEARLGPETVSTLWRNLLAQSGTAPRFFTPPACSTTTVTTAPRPQYCKCNASNWLPDTKCWFWTILWCVGSVWFSLSLPQFQYRIEVQVNCNLRWHITANVIYVVSSPNCDNAFITVQSSLRPFHGT